ncbi:hypothetical protein L3X38_013104 [Prunus dulcis]|uniref:Uncharacterized protein n=1 Tax=Prunus dulcis TaxID=3755 RepID=A0AAD4WNA6_PRUDU|nr:hypothetical protein L3X38_013104 [Prunus dulcis]
MPKEVKVGALHKVPMWDFVQVAVVATRVLEIRFGSWELRQVSGIMGEGVVALVLVALMLGGSRRLLLFGFGRRAWAVFGAGRVVFTSWVER